MRILLNLLLAFLLSSCANVSKNFMFDPNKATGLVVGSVSYESGFGKYYIVAKGQESTKLTEFGFGCPVFPCFEPANDSRFSAAENPKQRGGGFAVEVPEGRYRILGWRVRQGQMDSRSQEPINIDFTVERGKVSYLGNLHFDAHWEDVHLRDKASRDLPLLREDYPVLNTASFASTIAPNTDIGKLGGEYKRGIEGPIFVPIVPVRR